MVFFPPSLRHDDVSCQTVSREDNRQGHAQVFAIKLHNVIPTNLGSAPVCAASPRPLTAKRLSKQLGLVDAGREVLVFRHSTRVERLLGAGFLCPQTPMEWATASKLTVCVRSMKKISISLGDIKKHIHQSYIIHFLHSEMSFLPLLECKPVFVLLFFSLYDILFLVIMIYYPGT